MRTKEEILNKEVTQNQDAYTRLKINNQSTLFVREDLIYNAMELYAIEEQIEVLEYLRLEILDYDSVDDVRSHIRTVIEGRKLKLNQIK